MFDPTRLAGDTVSAYISTGKMPEAPADAPIEWLKPGAAFVCIKKNGSLRGCVGTFTPTRASLVEEIMHNAVSSAVNDTRFLPVGDEELASLEFSVDILDPPRQVMTADELDPKVFGIVVKAGSRLGLLLPDLEGVDTVEKQIAIAKQKAGIGAVEAAELWRFRVRRYEPVPAGGNSGPGDE
ncbi:MAG: AmmeMemoRadiSam system protein A [Actinomycetota bacterium]|nr:AmmeMemoRadiSam system protein A [Actinomycetota bacterium]